MKGEMVGTTRVSRRVPVGSSVERKEEEPVQERADWLQPSDVGNGFSIDALWRYTLTMPKAYKRRKYMLQFIPVLAVIAALAAVILSPVFTPPQLHEGGGVYLAGKCYVGSCTLDELLG